MRDMATDVEPLWDELLSDIRIHQGNLKQGIGACWEEAIAVLGLSPSGSSIICFDLLTPIACSCTESEWPESESQVDQIARALDTRKHLFLDEVENVTDHFNDSVL